MTYSLVLFEYAVFFIGSVKKDKKRRLASEGQKSSPSSVKTEEAMGSPVSNLLRPKRNLEATTADSEDEECRIVHTKQLVPDFPW